MSTAPLLLAGYFASEMNARKSLGGFCMQYVLCGHNNVQRAPLMQLPAQAGSGTITITPIVCVSKQLDPRFAAG